MTDAVPINQLSGVITAAAAHVRAGRFHDAAELYESFLRTAAGSNGIHNPDCLEVWLLLARLYIQDSRHGDAVACFHNYLRHNPNSVNCWIELGNHLKNTKQNELALDCFHQAIHFDPGKYEAHLRCAEIHEDCNRTLDAHKYYQKALDLSNCFALAIRKSTVLPVIPMTNEEIDAAHEQVLSNLSHIRRIHI